MVEDCPEFIQRTMALAIRRCEARAEAKKAAEAAADEQRRREELRIRREWNSRPSVKQVVESCPKIIQ